MTMNPRIRNIALLSASLLFSTSLPAFAIFPFSGPSFSSFILPSIDISETYNDNVFFSRVQDKGDFVTRITPQFTGDFRTELLRLNCLASLSFLEYQEESSLDDVNQKYRLSGRYRVTERDSITGKFFFIGDTTLEENEITVDLGEGAETSEVSFVTTLSDRKWYESNIGYNYRINELNDVRLSYIYSAIQYQDENDSDFSLNRLVLSLKRKLLTQQDYLKFQSSYVRRNTEINSVDNYQLSIGWNHIYPGRWELKNFFGVRYTDIQASGDREDFTGWGGIADISVKKFGEIYQGAVGYRRNLRNSSSGNIIEVDRLYCTLSKYITPRFIFTFEGNFYFTQEEGEEKGDTWFFELNPHFQYYLTENHYFAIGYSYTEEYDKSFGGNRDLKRNKFWISLSLKYPDRW